MNGSFGKRMVLILEGILSIDMWYPSARIVLKIYFHRIFQLDVLNLKEKMFKKIPTSTSALLIANRIVFQPRVIVRRVPNMGEFFVYRLSVHRIAIQLRSYSWPTFREYFPQGDL